MRWAQPRARARVYVYVCVGVGVCLFYFIFLVFLFDRLEDDVYFQRANICIDLLLLDPWQMKTVEKKKMVNERCLVYFLKNLSTDKSRIPMVVMDPNSSSVDKNKFRLECKLCGCSTFNLLRNLNLTRSKKKTTCCRWFWFRMGGSVVIDPVSEIQRERKLFFNIW